MSDSGDLKTWAAGLEAEDDQVRAEAAKAILGALGRPDYPEVEAALALLQTSWWPLHRELVMPAVDAVLSATRRLDVEASALEDAMLLLGHLGREDAAVLDRLAAAFGESSAGARRAAAGSAGRVGEAAVRLVPQLIEALGAPQDEVGSAALESLGALGALAPETIAPALLTEAERTGEARRYFALAGLRALLEDRHRAGAAPLPLPKLESVARGALDDEQAAVRLEAAALMGLSPSHSAEGNAALERLLGDESMDVAAWAAVALLRRGADPARPAEVLRRLLLADVFDQRLAALTALDGLEPVTAARIESILDEAAKSGPDDVRPLCRELVDAVGVLKVRRTFSS